MDRGSDGRLIGPPSQCSCGRTLAGIMPVFQDEKERESMTYYCPHCKIQTQPDQQVRDNERCILCGYKMEVVK